jgi:hypothetical protein
MAEKCDHTDVISFTFSKNVGGQTISRCVDNSCTRFDIARKAILGGKDDVELERGQYPTPKGGGLKSKG